MTFSGREKHPRLLRSKSVSSQKHWDVIYICEFSPDQWSAKMDEIIEALTDQLTMKQDLNRGLLMSLSFHEE